MVKKFSLLMIFLAVSGASVAQQPLGGALVHDLSLCDKKFFHALVDHLYEVSKLGNLQTHNDYAFFRVANRRMPSRSMVRFSEPLVVGNIALDGYFDDIVDVNAQTSLISWGFLAPTSVRDAQAALKPFLWDYDRFRADGPVFVRSELWEVASPEKGWQKIATESGEPKPGTLERVFLIEPSRDVPRHVRIGCSVQGSVTSSIVQDLRPDLSE